MGYVDDFVSGVAVELVSCSVEFRFAFLRKARTPSPQSLERKTYLLLDFVFKGFDQFVALVALQDLLDGLDGDVGSVGKFAGHSFGGGFEFGGRDHAIDDAQV